MGLGIVRFEPDDLGEVADGSLGFVPVEVDRPPVYQRVGMFRVQPDGLPEVLDALAGAGPS